jgi:hypothetical protein
MLCVNCAKVFAKYYKPQYFEGILAFMLSAMKHVDNIDAILEIFFNISTLKMIWEKHLSYFGVYATRYLWRLVILGSI